MFSRLEGLASLSGYIFLPLSQPLLQSIVLGFPLTMYLLSFLAPCLAMSVLHFLYIVGLYPWDVSNVCFTFPLCVIALCMMYIYLYMLVCGLLCTSYDGPSWLRERPSLAMSALDLVVWVCAQGNCCRCIFMLYCVHNHRGVTDGASLLLYSHGESQVRIVFCVL